MAKYRNTGGSDLLDRGSHFLPSFELDALDAALLDESDCGLESLSGGDLIRAHGKVSNLVIYVNGDLEEEIMG